MMQTIEAVIDEKGKVHLLESIILEAPHRVFITILPNLQDENKDPVDITKLGEILDDDLDTARKDFTQSFFKSIENSAQQLEQN